MQMPAAAPKIEGAMAQVVAGLSAYTYIDQSIYFEAGVYRSALQGASVANNGNLNNNVISGVAPYWRIAYETDWGDNSWEFGTFGLEAQLENPTTPAGGAINISLQNAPTDRFLDVGLDTQYQYIDDETQVTVTGRWTHENDNLTASFGAMNADNTSDNLNFASLVGSYYWHRKLGISLGFFDLLGSTDTTYFGSANGKPDSTYGNVEIDYVPWLNVKLGLQYNAFFKFNGATSNYDGAGRNASDNNMLFAYIWFAY
jgi:hypothetical protein